MYMSPTPDPNIGWEMFMRSFAVFFQEGALSTEDELKLHTATGTEATMQSYDIYALTRSV